MSVESTPDVTPTPATINPTSPLDTIPIPTLIDFVLSFLRNNIDGSPHPTSFVEIAIAMIIPAIIKTSILTPLKSTWAPIIAKNRWCKNKL